MAEQETKKNKQSLKETNPIEYYKKRRTRLRLATYACNITPPLAILLVYIIVNSTGGLATPLNPVKFSFGMILLVIGTVVFTTHILGDITKQHKEQGKGALYTTAIVWAYVGLVLWLLYLTMFYLIIFCMAEFVGTALGAICTSKMAECTEYINKNSDAELQANAYIRVQEKQKVKEKKKDSVPIE